LSEVLLEKLSSQKCIIFQPHLAGASVYTAKHETRKLRLFTEMLHAVFATNTRTRESALTVKTSEHMHRRFSVKARKILGYGCAYKLYKQSFVINSLYINFYKVKLQQLSI